MAQKFIGVTLPIRLGQTGMFEQSVSVIQQTRSNFKNLILTKKGERVGQPQLGCDLWKVLFETMNEETEQNARAAVEEAVNRWLPFIELINFTITPVERDNMYNITCLYRFKNNPNVVDEVAISTTQLGTPTVGFQGEPQTQQELDEFSKTVQEARAIRKLQEARRLRRI